jgi:hypothetical protein
MRLPAILACRSIVRTHSVCRRQRITGRKPQHERMYLFLTPGWNRRPAGAPHAPNNPLGAIALQRRCNICGVDCSPAAPQPTMATLRRLSAWPPPPPAARARILRRSPRRRAPSHITAREPRLGTADSRAAEKCAEIGATNRSGGTFRTIGNNDESSLTPRRIWAHLGTKAVSSRIRAAFSVGGARRADAAGTQGARAVVAAAAALTKPTAGGGPAAAIDASFAAVLGAVAAGWGEASATPAEASRTRRPVGQVRFAFPLHTLLAGRTWLFLQPGGGGQAPRRIVSDVGCAPESQSSPGARSRSVRHSRREAIGTVRVGLDTGDLIAMMHRCLISKRARP